MFSQKKKFPWIWVITVILIILAGVYIIALALSDNSNDGNVGRKEEATSQMEGTADDPMEEKEAEKYKDDRLDQLDQPSENAASNNINQSYYLVKNSNNIIKVFYYDRNGDVVELDDTNIMYDMLSQSDQKRFDSGVRVGNRDELNRLLMDYES